MNPPSLPSTSNYQHLRVMARAGDGRGPYLPYRNSSQADNQPHAAAIGSPDAKPKRKRNAPNSGSVPQEKRKRGVPVPTKITYRDQSEIMNQIFGSKSLLPRKMSHVYNAKQQSSKMHPVKQSV